MPELSEKVEPKLNFNKALEEYKEAKAAGIITRPVNLGPLSYILLGKKARKASPSFQLIDVLPKLLPVYKQLLSELGGGRRRMGSDR